MILAVDGSNLWMQSAHLVDWEGDQEQAVGATMHLAIRTLAVVVREVRPDRLFFAWDLPGQTFRHIIAPSYKAARGPRPDDDRAHRSDRFKDLLREMRVCQMAHTDVEADDIIAWVWRRNWDEEGRIWSGDKDLLQLTDRWPQYRAKQWWDCDRTTAELVHPSLLPYYQALVGDTIDGVPGVRGIGPKKAQAILTEVGAEFVVDGPLDDTSARLEFIANLLAHPKLQGKQDEFWAALHLVDLRNDHVGARGMLVSQFCHDTGEWDLWAAQRYLAEHGPEWGLNEVSEQAASQSLFGPDRRRMQQRFLS